jgi:hypothetical protein
MRATAGGCAWQKIFRLYDLETSIPSEETVE